MNPERWTTVDRYLERLFVEPDAHLDAALARSASAGLPAHAVSPLLGKLLYLLARLANARAILELGTLGAYSTIWLARALPEGGRLVTLEAVPAHADVARRNLAAAGLDAVVEVRVGAALESLSALESEAAGPFDLVFLDADKKNNPAYLAAALRLSRVGTLIVADNVVRGGAVAGDAAAREDESAAGVRRFHEILASDPRVVATAVQTVGAKGWDGMTFALVVAADGGGARDDDGGARDGR